MGGSYPEKSDAKVKAEAEGWQWLPNSIGTILLVYLGTTHMDEYSEEISNSTAAQARSEVGAVPMNCRRLEQFFDDIRGDVEQAQKALGRDADCQWAERCVGASANGARALHKVTKVKAIPTPVVVNHGYIVAGGPVPVAKKEVEDDRKLWAASHAAPKAWVPDRSSCRRLPAEEIRNV
eukprot:7817741-Pyramimonas_sp.AAC.1